MAFEFCDRTVVESEGWWNLDTLEQAWTGLDRLLNTLNDQYRHHTQSEGNPAELNFQSGRDSLYRSGRALITNSKDSINIKRARQIADYMGEINISVRVSVDQLKVTIEDNGAGIDPEVEPHLFTWLWDAPIPDYLLKKGMERRLGITGQMGDDLRYIKQSIEGLGGRVFYKNKGRDIGAIFGYEVPMSSLVVPQAQPTK